MDVDGSEGAFAKYGFLGMSLVSILRGRGGSWPEVLAAQDRYVSEAPALAAEAHQLELLARAGVPVSALLGYSRGVLVSEQLIGPTLADQLVGRPEHAAEWLEETWSRVEQLHQPAPPDRTVSRGLLPRGSISATFERKLTGAGAGRFISGFGAGWLDAPARQAVCWSVERSVRGLSRLCSGREGSPGRGESGVVFGDLKPEHVIFRHSGGPVLCDPMVHRAGSVADVAKLVSRVARARFTSSAAGPDQRLGGLHANAPLLSEFGRAMHGYPGTVLVLTNPVDLMVRLFAEASEIEASFGIGSNLDSARFRAVLAELHGVDIGEVTGSVVGEHGATMTLLASTTTVRGDLVPVPAGQIRDAVLARSPRVSAALGRTSVGPAGAVVSTLRRIIGHEDGIEELSVSGTGGVFYGQPVEFRDGSPQVLPVAMSSSEAAQLAASIARLEDLYRTVRVPPVAAVDQGG